MLRRFLGKFPEHFRVYMFLDLLKMQMVKSDPKIWTPLNGVFFASW